jgi:glycosyltransferase involved in cell wall biosynthesis
MENKLVSVLLLSMNHERYIEQACNSILNQSWPDIEILYVDNNSSDQTFENADKILKNSKLPYKGSKRDRNYGISANLNYLLKEASGDFIAVLSGDDWWERDNLKLKIDLLLKDQKVGLVHSNGYKYQEQTKRFSIFYEIEQKTGYLFNDLLSGNLFSATSIVYRHEALRSVGFFDENLLIEDWDMNLRISENYKIDYIHIPLTFARITGFNTSTNISFMDRGYEEYLIKYAKYPQVIEANYNLKLAHAFQLAKTDPTLKSLVYILKNIQFRINYMKQIVRCFFGILRIKI